MNEVPSNTHLYRWTNKCVFCGGIRYCYVIVHSPKDSLETRLHHMIVRINRNIWKQIYSSLSCLGCYAYVYICISLSVTHLRSLYNGLLLLFLNNQYEIADVL